MDKLLLLVFAVFSFSHWLTMHYRFLSQTIVALSLSVSFYLLSTSTHVHLLCVSVCPLHDVVTEEVDSSRRRNPGLSLLLFYFVFNLSGDLCQYISHVSSFIDNYSSTLSFFLPSLPNFVNSALKHINFGGIVDQ